MCLGDVVHEDSLLDRISCIVDSSPDQENGHDEACPPPQAGEGAHHGHSRPPDEPKEQQHLDSACKGRKMGNR